MAGLEEGKMKQVTVKIATEADFFQRGHKIARLADRAESLPEEYVISFKDPAEMLKLLTTTRLALLQTLKEQPGSITQLAQLPAPQSQRGKTRCRRVGSLWVSDR
ncbi:MAG: hypothetical protein MZV65_01880 [Chromatiales bacterium]|nr:hypothetical protein [Chromatiales bacterium]